MKNMSTKKIFKKVLVPIIHGCDQTSAINAARAITGEEDVMFLGLVYVPEGKSLSSATRHVQEVRQALKNLSSAQSSDRWTEVYATHHPWNEIVKITKKEAPDLLILQYPCHFEALDIQSLQSLADCPKRNFIP